MDRPKQKRSEAEYRNMGWPQACNVQIRAFGRLFGLKSDQVKSVAQKVLALPEKVTEDRKMVDFPLSQKPAAAGMAILMNAPLMKTGPRH